MMKAALAERGTAPDRAWRNEETLDELRRSFGWDTVGSFDWISSSTRGLFGQAWTTRSDSSFCGCCAWNELSEREAARERLEDICFDVVVPWGGYEPTPAVGAWVRVQPVSSNPAGSGNVGQRRG